MTEPTELQETEETTVLSFDEMPLSDDVKQALAEMGYTRPAQVQYAVYEPAVQGRDLVVQARTGTGKTAAFGIPLVDQMVKRSLRAPQVLVLTPTRELALQVSREIERIGGKRGVRPVSVYGGAPIQRQIDALRDGAQIVVGTPGRVLDHLSRGTLNPKDLRILILDESDEMLSMGFERELNAIIEFLPEQRQTLLFSATLPPEIVRMASTQLHDPQFIYLSGDSVGALEILHFVCMVMTDKSDALLRMLEVEDPESALIFCNTRDETERVAALLQRAGFDADWLNGDLPQSDREKVMTRSKNGSLRFLVATDVAARGIDISHLTHVINFDFPESSEVYVHRTGRTGRMGRTGTAISLVTPHDIGALYYLRLTYKINPFEKQLPSEGDRKTRAEADLIALLVEAFGSQEPHPDDIALARRLLTHDRSETIIAGLLRSHLGDRVKSQDEAAEARRGRRPQPNEQPSSEPPRPPSMPTPRANRSTRRGRRVDSPRDVPESAVNKAESPAMKAPSEPADPVEEALIDPPVMPPEPESFREDDHDDHDDHDDPPTLPPPPMQVEDDTSEGFDDEEPTGRHQLPRYEISPMTDEDLELAQNIQNVANHASFADWSPPVEENDDQVVFSRRSSSAPEAEVKELEVFLNVGRRDGVRPGDFLLMLTGAPGLTRDDIGRIRIRDKHTFIAVRAQVIDEAVKALHGRAFGDRIASANRARPREE